MIYEANKEIAICVKTSTGTSQEYHLTNRIMQGDTWAPGQASAQVDSFGKELILEQPRFMYRFKGEVPIPLLGQVDDLLGVSIVGHKAEQLNGFVNEKTAEKDLQFCSDKCNYMIVSKVKSEASFISELFVHSWQQRHTEERVLKEDFFGKVKMNETDSLLYLGYMLSPTGNNLPNINHKKTQIYRSTK